ncbi:MAG: NAD-dependent epimerase/dehydratase family protein [Candidatus Hodarchaeota archaeon]
MKKKVLLTGASGNVGFLVFKELLLRKDEYNIRLLVLGSKDEKRLFKPYNKSVEIVWGDLRDPVDVEEAVTGVDVIIHLGALIPPTADRYPALAEAVNVGGTKNILDSMKKQNKPVKLIYSSSVAVYGDRVKNPWITVNDPLNPSVGDEYAVTKIKAERLIQASGLRWAIFRFSAITNLNYKLDPIMFHVPLDTSIEYCLAEDAAYCLVQAIECDEILGHTYNLGGGEKCRATYRELVSTILGFYGISSDVLFDELFATTNFHCGFYADGMKLDNLLRFQRGGLEDYYDLMNSTIPSFQKWLFRFIPKIFIRKYFERISEPFQALKNNDEELIMRFYGEIMSEFEG